MDGTSAEIQPSEQKKAWQNAECIQGELTSAWGSKRGRRKKVVCQEPEWESHGMRGGKTLLVVKPKNHSDEEAFGH